MRHQYEVVVFAFGSWRVIGTNDVTQTRARHRDEHVRRHRARERRRARPRPSSRAPCGSPRGRAPPSALPRRAVPSRWPSPIARVVFSRASRGSEGGEQAGGAGGGTTLRALERVDAAWAAIRNMPEGDAAGPAPSFVTESREPIGGPCDYDVAVCGGTLGILLAAALQTRGQRVVVVERGPLKGRDQEWNISRPELETLVPLGVLTQAQVDRVITKEFNPIRCGFHGSDAPPMITRDILNTGVKPSLLLECVRENFEAAGGTVMERAALGRRGRPP